MADEVRYRRSPHVVCYWKNGNFVFDAFATGIRSGASALACDVLDFFDDWKTLDALEDYKPDIDRALLQQLIDALVAASLLHRAGQPLSAAETAMSTIDAWNPEAGFFHSATKNMQFRGLVAQREEGDQSSDGPMPATIKRYAGAATVSLPPPRTDAPLAGTLLARRTWRRFGEGSVPVQTLSTLLGLTAGVQYWVDVPGQGKVALKTSPSGGARHSIELYVLALKIDGLSTGLYHYVPDLHVLELLNSEMDRNRIPAYLPGNEYWSEACALVLFSAVYEREIWRYGYSRAYRAPLVEAGHLCQSFCLLATAYGLAPFCAMAFADSPIEDDLQIDGISESVLYTAGIGIRPTDARWAIAPSGIPDPETTANPYLQPRRDRHAE